jgi:pimeloyl-ACP methyl ester carboxylesterase
MHKVISKDGTSIAYDKRGSGPAVILVLGALDKRGSGQKIAKQLADHFTVVSYDRRGRGDSTDTLPYTTSKEIDDLEALIDELGGSAYLYGYSSGAVLALLATEALGKKVAGLALYELPYNKDPYAQKAIEEYKNKLREALDADKRGEATELFLRLVGVTDNQISGMQRIPLWKNLTAMAPTLAYDSIAIMESYPHINTKGIRVPVIVMYGTKSPAFMRETAESLSRSLPNATLKPLDDQEHDVKPGILAPHLGDFFSESHTH